MAILIDGYNLLHVTGIFSQAVGPGSVEKLHAQLVDFLAVALNPADVAHTTVVFDAKGRRAVARRSLERSGIKVHYAARHEDADTLLAELIQDHPAPRRLVVVSSDHQVQRAAKRRKAKAIDSEVWYAELLRSRKERQQSAAQPADVKPAAPLSESDAAWWLAQFAPDLIQELEADAFGAKSSAPAPAPTDSILESLPRSGTDAPQQIVPADDSSTHPFPASYLEAIQREIQSNAEMPDVRGPQRNQPKRRRKKRP